MSLERRGASRARSIDGPSPGSVPAPAAPPSSSSTARDGDEARIVNRPFRIGCPTGRFGKFGLFSNWIPCGLPFGRSSHGVPELRWRSLPCVSRIGEDVSHSKARVCPVETREGHPSAKLSLKSTGRCDVRLYFASFVVAVHGERLPPGMRFGYRFSPRSALLAAGRGLRRRARRRDGRRSDPNGARSPDPSSTITGRVAARVRSRFDPRDAPTGSQPRHGTALGKRVTGRRPRSPGFWVAREFHPPRFILRAA